MDPKSIFAGRTLILHLLRGGVGIAALWYAIRIGAEHPLASLALGVVALLAFRGCPLCWIIGLCETASRTAQRKGR